VVALERGITLDVVDVRPFDDPDELLRVSPIGKLPVLVDGDVVVPDSRLAAAYLGPEPDLDERESDATTHHWQV